MSVSVSACEHGVKYKVLECSLKIKSTGINMFVQNKKHTFWAQPEKKIF